jgi:hypothetical protein
MIDDTGSSACAASTLRGFVEPAERHQATARVPVVAGRICRIESNRLLKIPSASSQFHDARAFECASDVRAWADSASSITAVAALDIAMVTIDVWDGAVAASIE